MSVLNVLLQFDGKHTAPLEPLTSIAPQGDVFVEELFVFCFHDTVSVQVAATWVLKQRLANGDSWDEAHWDQLTQRLIEPTYWEVSLHLLQMLCDAGPQANETLSKRSRPLTKQIERLASDSNKFVRAWAVSLLVRMAESQKRLRNLAKERVIQSEQDESAAVRARMRRLRKEAKWLDTH